MGQCLLDIKDRTTENNEVHNVGIQSMFLVEKSTTNFIIFEILLLDIQRWCFQGMKFYHVTTLHISQIGPHHN